MTSSNMGGVSRRGLLGVFAATLVTAAPTCSNAFSFLRGAGDVRRISMYSGRTGESLNTIYWIEGEYIPEVVKEINHFSYDHSERLGDCRQVSGCRLSDVGFPLRDGITGHAHRSRQGCLREVRLFPELA